MPRKSRKPVDPKLGSDTSLPPDQTTLTAATSPGSGRDAEGRYAANNSGGPGNPHARHCARMLLMFRNAITDDEMGFLCRVLYEKALTGDMSAIKLICQYKLGKPLPAPNPDQLDRDEWDHFQRDVMKYDEMKEVLRGLPSRVGNTIVAGALPNIVNSFSKKFGTQLLESLSPDEQQAVRERIEASNNAAVASDLEGSPGNLNSNCQNPEHVALTPPKEEIFLAPPPTVPASKGATISNGKSAKATAHHKASKHGKSQSQPEGQPISNGKSRQTTAAPKKSKLRRRWVDEVAKRVKV